MIVRNLLLNAINFVAESGPLLMLPYGKQGMEFRLLLLLYLVSGFSLIQQLYVDFSHIDTFVSTNQGCEMAIFK